MNSKNHIRVVLMTLLAMLLIGQSCAGNSEATSLPITSIPTETITFRLTPTSAPTNMNTALPTFPPETLPVTIPTTEASNNTLNLTQMTVEEWASTSPDGKWVAVGLVAFQKENIGGHMVYVRLLVFRADGSIRWTIIDEWKEIGLGFPIPAPLKWSQDNQYFYFTFRAIPDGCSAFPYLTDLQQVNLKDGKVKDLLPDPVLSLALSPDDSQLAYFYGSSERGLVVRDLTTEEERETKIDPGKDFEVGNILWSPDGKALALTLAINPCTGPYGVSKTVWAESTTILWIDAQTLQRKVLINEDPRLFVTHEWTEPEKITVVDGEENSLWHLDVNTGEISRP